MFDVVKLENAASAEIGADRVYNYLPFYGSNLFERQEPGLMKSKK